MKIRNKKTGEVKECAVIPIVDGYVNEYAVFEKAESLAELNAEWEDVPEEPKRTWFIDTECGPNYINYGNVPITDHCYDEWNELGICFETKEEAEKAVEKLKAWKRLRDKGFRFILDEETEMPMFIYSGANGEKCITNAEESKQCRSDIKLLFGGEE